MMHGKGYAPKAVNIYTGNESDADRRDHTVSENPTFAHARDKTTATILLAYIYTQSSLSVYNMLCILYILNVHMHYVLHSTHYV